MAIFTEAFFCVSPFCMIRQSGFRWNEDLWSFPGDVDFFAHGKTMSQEVVHLFSFSTRVSFVARWYRSARGQRRGTAYPAAGWRVLRVDLFRVKYESWVAFALDVGHVYPVRNTRRFPRLQPELVIYLRMEWWPPSSPVKNRSSLPLLRGVRCSRICSTSGSEDLRMGWFHPTPPPIPSEKSLKLFTSAWCSNCGVAEFALFPAAKITNSGIVIFQLSCKRMYELCIQTSLLWYNMMKGYGCRPYVLIA